MKRFECLQAIAPLITDELFVTTAGGATNEWNAVRPSDANIQVKTLGLCSSIGLGLAIALPTRKVFVFDGDGALWMNLGSLATIGLHQPKNLIHICWNNRQYESSGGEPTVATAGTIDFAGIAKNAGIESSRAVTSVDELKDAVAKALKNPGPHFICANIEAGRTEAPPLKYDELENKYRFIRYVEDSEGVSILRIPQSASYLLK
jgi:thiamine pyrophosphate-dependent acetolactate synthase large subunit-like protein